MTVFVDSNVPMYVAGRDHPCRPAALQFLEQVRAGTVVACTSTGVLQEILYRYHGMGRPELAAQVYELFVELCPTVLPVTLADIDRARQVLAATAAVSVRDALHAGVMLNHGIQRIATFDSGFDAIAGIQRLALAELGATNPTSRAKPP